MPVLVSRDELSKLITEAEYYCFVPFDGFHLFTDGSIMVMTEWSGPTERAEMFFPVPESSIKALWRKCSRVSRQFPLKYAGRMLIDGVHYGVLKDDERTVIIQERFRSAIPENFIWYRSRDFPTPEEMTWNETERCILTVRSNNDGGLVAIVMPVIPTSKTIEKAEALCRS